MQVINIDDAIRHGEKLPIREYSPAMRGELINRLQTGFDITKRQVQGGYLRMGMYWSFLMINKMHLFWGSHVKTANDLIKELNPGVSRSLLDHYARIWKTFGEYLEKADLAPPVSRLIMAHPVIMGIEDPIEREAAIQGWSEKAEHLPHEAYMAELAIAKGQINTIDCLHEKCEPFSRCCDCGKFFRP